MTKVYYQAICKCGRYTAGANSDYAIDKMASEHVRKCGQPCVLSSFPSSFFGYTKPLRYRWIYPSDLERKKNKQRDYKFIAIQRVG